MDTMTKGRTARRVIGVLATGAIALAGLAATTQVEDEQLFLRAEGCGADQQPGRLTYESGPDGSDGCGGIGGLPFNEVFHQLDLTELQTFTTGAGFSEVLAAGGGSVQITAEAWFGDGTPSAGQSVVDVELKVRDATRSSGFQHTLLAESSEVVGVAVDGRTVHEIAFEVPAELDGLEISAMQIGVQVRGANQNGSNLGLEGDSLVTFPTLVEVDVAEPVVE